MACGCSDDLSQEQKQKITARSQQGFSATIIAAQLGVHKAAVVDWLSQPVKKSKKKKDGSTKDI